MIPGDAFTLFALLVFGHALGDFPLQNDYMARGKNWKTPVPEVPWYYLLGTHSIIHGGLAGLATGSVIIGTLETILHFLVDSLKNRGAISVQMDQWLHIACKALWVFLIMGDVV